MRHSEVVYENENEFLIELSSPKRRFLKASLIKVFDLCVKVSFPQVQCVETKIRRVKWAATHWGEQARL